MNRLFGVVKGAGVQVREVTPAAPIEQGPLGTTVLAGIFRSGPTIANPSPQGHQVVSLPSGAGQFRRIFGGLTQASEAPLSAEHFYNQAAGAGQLHVLRVTDGSEVQAQIPVYNRDVERSASLLFPNAKVAAKVAIYSAQNGGRWGGRRAAAVVVVAAMATAVTGDSTIELGLAAGSLLDDQFEGATLRIPTVDAIGEYKIATHDDTGAITIEGVWSDAILASTGTTVQVAITLENVHELTGELEDLAIEIGDSAEGNPARFSLFAHRDGVAITEWINGDLEQGSSAFWLDKVAGDLANYELDFSASADLFSGDPSDPLQRPANWAGIAQLEGITTGAPNTVQLQITQWTYVGAGDPYLEATTYAGTERPCTIVCTFTSGTAFDYVVTFDDGGSYAVGSGLLGTAVASPTGLFPAFTLRGLTTAPVSSEVLTIVSRPLPADLASKGALLFPAAAPSEGDTRLIYRVTGNTHDSVTVSPSVDLSTAITVPTAPNSTASGAGPHTLTGGETFIYDAGDGAGDVTLTSTLGAGSFTNQEIVDELNALTLAAYTPAAVLVRFDLDDAGLIRVVLEADAGADASFDIDGATSTLTNVVGWPITDVSISNGVDATICRLQYRQGLGGGYDGIANIADSDYEIALDPAPEGAALSRLLPLNTGLIAIAAPGVSSPAVQGAVMQWAYTHNGIAAVELPDTVISDSAAVAYHEANLAVGVAQDYHFCPFPSYGKITNPYGDGLYTTSMLGAILGRHARMALDAQGFQQAPAGLGASLSPLFKDLTTGDAVLNNELLNGYGLIEVRKRGASIYLWGDRIPGNTGRPFLHERKTLSHVGRVLLTNTEALVFKPINAFTFAAAQRDVRDLFLPWWRSGWFDDAGGAGFLDQVDIKVDDTNNPPLARSAGNLHIDIGFLVVGTAERVIFAIGPRGVEEG